MNKFVNISENTIQINGQKFDLFSSEGFRELSQIWLKVAWDQKHPYSFTWLGRPIIQNPEDIIRMQEVVWTIKPDVIIETGIAHGGSLIFYASLLDNLRKGKVIGIDIEIRSHNREALVKHPLFHKIHLIESSSVDDETIRIVKKEIPEDSCVMVVLDSAHTREHVRKELEMYSPLVSKGSYIVVTDGSQKFLGDTPRALKDYGQYAQRWDHDNPLNAIEEFLNKNENFQSIEPDFLFNESEINYRITHWPRAFLKNIK